MKILIVGGAGYLGGYMTDLFIENGHEVTVFDRLVYESEFLKNVPFINGDIRDYSLLTEVLPNFECVIWLAALVGDGACSVNESITEDINFKPVRWLSDNYRGKIVFTSTCSVYGKNDGILDEDSPTNPLSAYARTKLDAERYLLKKRPDSLVWRLGTLFGTGDSHSRIRTDLVVNKLSILAAQGESLTVFGGEQWRPLLSVKDVGHATLFAINNNITGLYNLSYKNYMLRDIAEEIVSIIPGSSVIYSNLAFEDQRNYQVDTGRFGKFGWAPSFSLADGVNEINKIVKEKRVNNFKRKNYSNAEYVSIHSNDLESRTIFISGKRQDEHTIAAITSEDVKEVESLLGRDNAEVKWKQGDSDGMLSRLSSSGQILVAQPHCIIINLKKDFKKNVLKLCEKYELQ